MPTPEPRIAYAPYDNYDMRVLRPGQAASEPGRIMMGYTIVDAPPGISVQCFTNPEHPDLEYYLNSANAQYQVIIDAEKFDAIKNKLEILVGTSVRHHQIYTDYFVAEVRLRPGASAASFSFGFENDMLLYGMKTRTEIGDFMDNHYLPKVSKVEGTRITLQSSEGPTEELTFEMLPRYQELEDPKTKLVLHTSLSAANKQTWYKHWLLNAGAPQIAQ